MIRPVNVVAAPRLLATWLCMLACSVAHGAESARSVIVLIPDGCSSEQFTLARWCKGKPLAQDAILVGAVQTYIADSVVADSAPAATAYATGQRSIDKAIGVGPSGKLLTGEPVVPAKQAGRPFASVLEGSRLLGKSTGIVVTSSLTHATPAGYLAHARHREMHEDIMEQAVYQNVDVLFGGGKRYLLPAASDGKESGDRRDGENLLDVLRAGGYQIVENRKALATLKEGKAIGVFARNHLEPEIDRPDTAPAQPDLAEAAAAAIRLLSRNPNGFFLMVEGSQVDWACHANDPGYMVSELLAFDRAVETALDFARKDGQTLVIVVSDHNTGGMSIGNAKSDKTYSQMSIETLVEPVKRMKRSSSALWKASNSPAVIKELRGQMLTQAGVELGDDELVALALRAAVNTHWGTTMTGAQAAEVIRRAAKFEDGGWALAEVYSRDFTMIGWATHGHSGGDVPLYAFGPQRPTGLVTAQDIGQQTARALGLNRERLTARLFADPAEALPGAEAQIRSVDANADGVVDERTVELTYKGKTAKLPVNKNIMQMDGKTHTLEGVVVWSPDTEKAYLPLQALRIMAGSEEPLPNVKQ